MGSKYISVKTIDVGAVVLKPISLSLKQKLKNFETTFVMKTMEDIYSFLVIDSVEKITSLYAEFFQTMSKS